MTGPEAYEEAQRLARMALNFEGLPSTAHVQAGQVSQTYALLAVAAASALNDHSSEGDGMPVADWNAWRDAAGVKSSKTAEEPQS